jgi:hypothetical protein
MCLDSFSDNEFSKGVNLKRLSDIETAFLMIFFQNGRSLNSSFSGGISSRVVCDCIF